LDQDAIPDGTLLFCDDEGARWREAGGDVWADDVVRRPEGQAMGRVLGVRHEDGSLVDGVGSEGPPLLALVLWADGLEERCSSQDLLVQEHGYGGTRVLEDGDYLVIGTLAEPVWWGRVSAPSPLGKVHGFSSDVARGVWDGWFEQGVEAVLCVGEREPGEILLHEARYMDPDSRARTEQVVSHWRSMPREEFEAVCASI
jgi:hypothetical protein